MVVLVNVLVVAVAVGLVTVVPLVAGLLVASVAVAACGRRGSRGGGRVKPAVVGLAVVLEAATVVIVVTAAIGWAGVLVAALVVFCRGRCRGRWRWWRWRRPLSLRRSRWAQRRRGLAGLAPECAQQHLSTAA